MLQLEILKLDDKYLEVKVRGETYTLFSPLVEYLSNDPDVEYVQFDVDHPLQENVYFKVKVRRGNPIEVVQRAVNAIISDLEELEKSFFS
ncbi:DNA-directed RNA polymerase, subunit L [Pyrobaculum islandicum DSM 4184]|uniref:DNA-directed RNA polymerase subunit Rpo11 n=1 Tax=Pyrobaculum islandicum (strain DSM 4184 / JCM 9189 / GEO3) TaxID=384616 RepID=A1RVG9_PYRIL|nr:DNA-directed RNA polymerase subunit L [Pyrobaculum islandicum]ABL88951.1 DNA-directed RNA polymerase, subunit L [Pyrobaculum islandicum DSM 4184]